MVYIDGVYDSKAYGAINHFEIPPSGIQTHVIGHNKKKIPIPWTLTLPCPLPTRGLLEYAIYCIIKCGVWNDTKIYMAAQSIFPINNLAETG
jgi:hypothetical protein